MASPIILQWDTARIRAAVGTASENSPSVQKVVAFDLSSGGDTDEGMTMADLMGAPEQQPRKEQRNKPRSVDDFDFDEEAFLAALDGNCRTPIAGQAKIVDGTLFFEGLIAKP